MIGQGDFLPPPWMTIWALCPVGGCSKWSIVDDDIGGGTTDAAQVEMVVHCAASRLPLAGWAMARGACVDLWRD